MEVADFWSGPLRAIQPLMRAIDARGCDPEALVADAVAMGANVMIVNGGGFLCWYPSQLASQRVNPYLDQDLLGETIRHAHRRGVRVLCRMDISKGYPEWFAEHPEWFARGPDGAPTTTWGLLDTCFSGGYWQREHPRMVEEILGRYEVDGFFYNYYRVARCTCPRCLPLDRGQALVAYTRALRDRVHPAVLVCYHHLREGWDEPGMAAATDLVAAQATNPFSVNPVDPQPRWARWAAEEAAWGRALRPDRPPLIILGVSAVFASRRMAQPGDRLAHDIFTAAAFGGAPCPAVNGTLRPEDPRPLGAVARSLTRLRRLKGVLAGRSDPSPIALCRPLDPAWRAEFRGLFAALVELRLPFDVVVPGGALGYPWVIHPGPPRGLAADGRLIVTAAALGPERDVTGGYLRVGDAGLRQALGTDVLAVEGRFWTLPAATDGDLHLVAPRINNAPEFAWLDAAAPGGPPGLAGGRLPWEIGRLYLERGIPEYRQLLGALLAEVTPWVQTDAPPAVTVRAARRGPTTLVHLVNDASPADRPFTAFSPVAGFSVRVPGATRVRALPRGREAESDTFRVTRLDDYAVLAFTAGPLS